MNKQLYEANMAALKSRKATFTAISRIAGNVDLSAYKVDLSKSGQPIISVTEKDTNIAYHSRYNPVKEAEKQIQGLYEGQSQIMIMGFGLGYATEYLIKSIPEDILNCQINIIEPDPKIFLLALQNRDLTTIISDDRVSFYVGMTVDEVGDIWNASVNWPTINDFCFIDHPPTVNRFKEYSERLIEKVKYLCNKNKGNLVTMMYSGYEFHTNNFANLANIFELPGVERLFGKFKNVPVVIVAAGPSLDKNVHLLNEIKGKFPIIAVDTALRQLISHGIKPDIVCAADSSYENSLDFVGVENETDVILAVEPMTHPDIIKAFKGPKMVMSFGNGLVPLYSNFREPVGTLVCWGSIATTVFDLARRMGANPIIFIGQDLAFQDGRLHARGSYSDDILYDKVNQYSSIEHEAANYINTKGKFRYKGSDGSILYTDYGMKMYRDWFEDQFRQTDTTIINATEGGLVDKYVELMPFRAAINLYSSKAVDVKSILKQILSIPVKANKTALIKTLEEVKKGLNLYQNKSRQLVKITGKLLKNCSNIEIEKLGGQDKADYMSVIELHDCFCKDMLLFSWLSTYKAKYMTKHTLEIQRLKSMKNALAGDWIKTVLEFFVNLDKFIDYQIPLIDEALIEILNKQGAYQ